ncbi:hypothetical protein NDA18_001332 [Ustilago nuda]|nr:hypothetical protein NDA18_001332 [Ustilago nuda]
MSLFASQRLPSGHNVLIQQSRCPGAYRMYSVLEGRREIRSRLLDPHPRVTTQRLAQLEAQQWITLAELKRLSLNNKAQDELLREMRSLLEAQQPFKVSKDPSMFSRAMSVVTELRDWLRVTLAEMLQEATEARNIAPAEEKPSGRQVISRNAVKAISFGLFYPILHYHAVTTSAADIMGVFLQTASLPMVLAMNPNVAKACHRIKKRGVLKGLFGGKKLRRSLSSSLSSHGYRKDVRR